MNTDENTESEADDLEKVVPEPLLPVWRRLAVIKAFRETHGDRYTAALEAITAAVLLGGYVYWVFLYLTQ